ncbi:MAG TPA: sulfatase [Polyangiaceae bacterium]
MFSLVVCCLFAGSVVGVAEFVALNGPAPVGLLAVAAAAGAVPGLSLGALIAFGAVLVRRFAPLRRWTSRLWQGTRSRLAAPAHVVSLHAWYLAVIAAAALTFFLAERYYARLWRLQSSELALDLSSAGAVVFAVLFAASALLVERPVRALVRRADARFGLPRPRNRALRFLVFGFLPALGLSLPFWWRHRELLRGHSAWLGVAVTVLVASLLAFAWLPLGRRLRRPVELCLLVLWLVGMGWSDRVLGARDASALLERTQFVRLGLTLARDAADFDFDGASVWLGERDCAPFDAERSPLLADRPGNGIDEDCDGADARGGPRVPVPRFAGAAAPLESRPYNVVWVIVDGLRPDRVGAYGSNRGLTPYLDAFAREAVVFDAAYAQSSSTLFSFSSMFSGINPAALSFAVELGRPQLDRRHTTLAERLDARGYASAIFMTGWTQRTYVGLQQGYEQAFTTHEIDVRGQFWTQHTAPFVTTQAIEFIEGALAEDRPFFATVYYHDTHYPYVRHPGDTDRGDGTEQRYDGEVAFVDRYLGFLLQYLRHRRPLYEQSIVVVTSDHGEEFGEHGRLQHARTCYVESTHVPLMLYGPKLEPRRVAADVALIDVVPTVLELVGATEQSDDLQGQSLLVPLFLPQRVDSERPIFCSVTSQWRGDERFFERSVRSGPFSLTLDAKSGRARLFDRRADPREQRDLAADPVQAARVDRFRKLLSEIHTGNLSDRLSAH